MLADEFKNLKSDLLRLLPKFTESLHKELQNSLNSFSLRERLNEVALNVVELCKNLGEI